jgi:hypothetical protein
MEETLYSIDIHKQKDAYLGRIYSNVDGVKEFRHPRIETLLKHISMDIQMAVEEFTNRTLSFTENKGQSVSSDELY